jgi:hypothetical protein
MLDVSPSTRGAPRVASVAELALEVLERGGAIEREGTTRGDIDANLHTISLVAAPFRGTLQLGRTGGRCDPRATGRGAAGNVPTDTKSKAGQPGSAATTRQMAGHGRLAQ